MIGLTVSIATVSSYAFRRLFVIRQYELPRSQVTFIKIAALLL
jgi:hypothetical protein